MLPKGRAVLLLLLLAACSPARTGEPGRGVLVIAIDGLRADHVHSAGYDRETTPELDELASVGFAFDQAFAAAPWEMPAHAALLTGCDAEVHKRILPADVAQTLATQWFVPDGAPRLAEEFLRAGWRTAMFADSPWLTPLNGFASGFEAFFECRLDGTTTLSDLGVEGATRRLVQWLRGVPSDRSWFAYVHLHDLERVWKFSDPMFETYFTPRQELATVPPVGDAREIFFAIPRHRWAGGVRTLGEYEAMYDGGILKLDRGLGRLFALLRQAERWDSTTVVVVGTHGLGFGESGLILDHGTLATVDLHVPLIVKPRAGTSFAAGTRTDALASHVDLFPTLLDLEGLPVPVDVRGLSLARVLAGQAPSPREYAFAAGGYQTGFAVMGPTHSLERTFPWVVRNRTLSRSWYGGEQTGALRVREVLVDRRLGPAARPVRARRTDPLAAGLLTAGFEWDANVQDLRKRLQGAGWIPLLESGP